MCDAFWQALGSPERCGCFFYVAWLLGEDFTTIHRQAIIPCQHLPEPCSGEAPVCYGGYCDFTSYLRWVQPEPPNAFWQKYDAAANGCES